MKQKENPAKAGQSHEAGYRKGRMFHGKCFTRRGNSQAPDPVAWTVRA
jgi:hypothetical protein